MAWGPTASLDMLRRRSELTHRIRTFFHRQGFDEVHTPILSRDTVVDIHIDPIVVPGAAIGLSDVGDDAYYLQTSPEFAMKRLVAAGMKAIYQITPALRAGERGAMHNPEFTMVEWYRTDDSLDDAVRLLSDLVGYALEGEAAEIATYQEVFGAAVGLDPLRAELDELRSRLAACLPGVNPHQFDRDECLDALFAECVQPRLGHRRPTIVTHYPASQAALACLSPSDPRVAERFELFYRGIELANGYHELLDPEVLQQRAEAANQRRIALGRAPLPTSSRLREAMVAGLPECSGCALGLDRLVLATSAAQSIDQVVAFPIELA
ncbi:MAG: EF-P lysine aminoacylase GenX [Pirellulaceae bacterium]|nr:MAG: EF-P lysine aminoacylase GenX [Pirellulaceae bacterium]